MAGTQSDLHDDLSEHEWHGDVRQLERLTTPGFSDSGSLPIMTDGSSGDLVFSELIPKLAVDDDSGWPRFSMRCYLTALRPRQWAKNGLVFVAPITAGIIFSGRVDLRVLIAFIVFCAVASGLYLFNDVRDVEKDRLHPTKRNRPIPSGQVAINDAMVLGSSLLVAGLAMAWLVLGVQFMVIVALYVAITLSYTYGLKNVAGVELLAVASGFVLRSVAGGVAVGIPLSNWFLVVAFSGALFIVIGKRYAEMQLLGDHGRSHRAVLGKYTTSFIKAALTVTVAVTVVSYSGWAFDRAAKLHQAIPHLCFQLTVIPVVVGVLYVLRKIHEGEGGAPEEMAFHDRTLQVAAGLCGVLTLVGLFG